VSEPQSFPIDKIHVPEKKRKALKPEVVEELAESILEVGQREAVLVRREKDHFVLVEGLHRLEACKSLGERTVLGMLISAEAARQRELPPQAPDPEHEKMERLRKLRLEKEAAEKLAHTSRAGSAAEGPTRQREHPEKTTRGNLTAPSKQSRPGRGAAPQTLSDWIKQQERSGGRY
jgi:ParB-like nuclease domain